MSGLLILLAVGAMTAQEAQAAPGCTPEHAAMGHCELPAPPAPPAPTGPGCTPEHAEMGHCTLPEPAPVDDPACPADHAAMGHCTPAPRAATDEAPVAIAPGPAPAAARSGPAHAADALWGGAAMAQSRRQMAAEHGAMRFGKLLVDRAEARLVEGRDTYLVDLQGWYGGDIDKLWLKAEIEGDWGDSPHEAELQALWSHAIGPWFDLQAGVRRDVGDGRGRSFLVLGVQGLAPYWVEVDGALFLSAKGDVTGRVELEHDVRISQQLVLQPRAEIDLSLQDVPELALGSGVTDAALGLRLRYQLSPQVAPYVGAEYARAFGDTRRFRHARGEDDGGVAFLAGVRLWF